MRRDRLPRRRPRSAPAPPGRSGRSSMHRLYLVPTLLINFVIILIPALLTIALAFCRLGRHHGADLRRARQFRGAVAATACSGRRSRNNIIWTASSSSCRSPWALLAASMLLIVRRGSNFFQVVYFLPVIIATAITARVWQGMIYSPVTGVFGLLQRLGMPIANPLAQPSTRALRRRRRSTSGTGGAFSASSSLPRCGRCRRSRSRRRGSRAPASGR